MLNKKLILILSIFICIFLVIIFIFFAYKKVIIGNNIINKNSSEILDTILNANSYKANISVKIKSNKNENLYKINQEDKVGEKYKQEILEPSNINGTVINYNGKDLSLENTKLNLSKIYQNYPYIIGNDLLLSTFLEEYKSCKNPIKQEQDDRIILSIRRE